MKIKRLCAALTAAALLTGFCLAEAPKLEIDPNAGVRVTPSPTPVPTPAPQRNIIIPGWSEISFDTNAEELVIDLYNPEDNADWFYMTYRFYIVHTSETGEQTEEELFSTGLVPPGLAINSVTLDHKVEPGEYEAIMFVQPYFMDSLEPTNSVNFPVKLTVTNELKGE